jgi:hypothetical protein
MSNQAGVSRRMFMRTAAVAAAAPTALAASAVAADSADVHVAATVVRASHSKTTRGALTIGVRASVLAEGFGRDNVVLAVDGVRFGASADDTRQLITNKVRERISMELERAGVPVSADRIAVQVFGGVL